MLRKTEKQRCKNPGIPSVDHGNWGWECDALREECCILWRITPYTCTFISPTKMTIFFGMVQFMNDSACKMSKVHARSHEITKISHYEFLLQKHCDYWLEKQTIMLRSVPQTLKKWRIVVNRIPKVRQTTCNWIKKILGEATRVVNVFLISWFFYCFYYVH